MGKGAIMVALAAIMATSMMYVTRNDSIVSRVAEEADYEAKVLAREAAQSAFQVVAGKVKRDFEGYRGSYADRDYKDATYDISASEEDDGSVTIVANGEYGDYEYTITGTVDRSGTRLIDALTLDGPVNTFQLVSNASISGRDTKVDGSKGSGANVHAVFATSAAVKQSLLDMNLGSRVVGTNGEGDIASGSPEIDLDELESAIRNYSGDALNEYNGNRTFNNGSLGSLGSPQVLRVDGDLKLKGGFVGYGIAYVQGRLKMEDSARWNGLVLVNAPGGDSHQMTDTALVRGAMILRTASEADSDDDNSDESDESDKSSKKSDKSSKKSDKSSKKSDKSSKKSDKSSKKSDKSSKKSDKSSKKSDKSSKKSQPMPEAALGSGLLSPVADAMDRAILYTLESVTSRYPVVRTLFEGYSDNAVVCHRPPGNPGNKYTITIGESALAAHEAHGDTQGACDDDIETEAGSPMNITIESGASITYSSQTLKVLSSLIEQIEILDDGFSVIRTDEEAKVREGAVRADF